MPAYSFKTHRSLSAPAVVSDPAVLTTPVLMTNPEDPNNPTKPLWSAGVGGADQVGYFGFKLTRNQRIRAAEDKLARLHKRRLRIESEIAETEDKLEMLDGSDAVEDLYERLGIAIDDDDDDDVFSPPPGKGGGGPFGLPGPRGGGGRPRGRR